MAHIIKLHHLSPYEVHSIEHRLRPYTNHYNVKVKFLKTCIYIHMENDQNYCGIFNMCHYYWHTARMSVCKRDLKWVMKYMRP